MNLKKEDKDAIKESCDPPEATTPPSCDEMELWEELPHVPHAIGGTPLVVWSPHLEVERGFVSIEGRSSSIQQRYHGYRKRPQCPVRLNTDSIRADWRGKGRVSFSGVRALSNTSGSHRTPIQTRYVETRLVSHLQPGTFRKTVPFASEHR